MLTRNDPERGASRPVEEEESMNRPGLVPAALLSAAVGAALAPEFAVGGVYVPPQSRTTLQMPGNKCSLTEYGPVFPFNKAGWKIRYGGGVSCAGGVSVAKTLSVYVQVRSPDRKRWVTIAGSGLTGG